jgi:hypothetical protein
MELGVEKYCIFHSRETPQARLYPRQCLVIKGAFSLETNSRGETDGIINQSAVFWAILQNILKEEASWSLSCNEAVRSWQNACCLVC